MPFYQFLQKREPVCYYQMAALAVQFPHFLKRFVFCQSEAHFASPWHTKGYFLLGLNICGSQIKEWAPRESFEFQQLVSEGVLCLSSQVLKRLCFLNWRRKRAEKGKWRKELKVHFIWGAFYDPSFCSPSSGWVGGFYILCAPQLIFGQSWNRKTNREAVSIILVKDYRTLY